MIRHFSRTHSSGLRAVALVCAALVATVPQGMLAADDTYDQGRAALDRRDWEQAAELFRRSSRGGGPSADAALYWEAYALGKLSRADRALSVLEELQRGYPDSRWLDDARALSAELRGAAAIDGPDDELKILALQGLLQSDPARALPHLEKFLASGGSPSAKEQALFLLLQTGLPRATEIVVQVAQDPKREPEVRAAAVRSLGIAGGARTPDLLADVYRSSGEVEVKRAVLEAYLVSGNEAGLRAVAESETDPELRVHAIHQLGAMGAVEELDRMFEKERSFEVRRALLQAFMVAGHEKRLVEIARTDADTELREEAIQQLGAMGATAELEALFERERSIPIRRALLHAFMVAGHQAPVVRAARDATSPELRDEAIDLLGVMGGTSELWEIYDAEKSTEVRQRILRAQAVGGGGDRLVSIARSDPDPTLRTAAIEGLGIGGSVSADALTEIYRKEKVVEVKHAVLQALFVRSEVRALIAISRAESDPGLKREAVQLLAVSRSEEATEYMLELLNERE